MNNKSRPDAVLKATGKNEEEWFQLITENGWSELPHREMAQNLEKKAGVTSWWAQDITVRYEKAAGRRVLGQTADSGFELGVSCTLPVDAHTLWETLLSPDGMRLITGEPLNPDTLESGSESVSKGIFYRITLLKPYSHFRMRLTLPGFSDYSILQVRVTAMGKEKSRLAFHQEKLMGPEARAEMKRKWDAACERFKDMLGGKKELNVRNNTW